MESKNAPISSLVYDPLDNVSRDPASGSFFADDADLIRLSTDFAVKGYIVSQGRMGVTPLQENEIPHAIEVLENLHRWFKDNRKNYDYRLPDGKRVNISPSDLLRTFEDLYLVEGDYVPEYRGVYGFRRSVALIWANAVRFKLGMPYVKDIPVDIETYTSNVERIEACLMENANKGIGTRPLGVHDYIFVGIEMFNNSVPEVRFRDIFRPVKGIDGQKLFNVCRTIVQYPDLLIFEQIKAGNIPWSKLDKDALRGLCNENALEETVKEYLYNLDKTTKRAKKMMDKKGIEAISKQCPDLVVREAFQGVMDADFSVWNARYVLTAKYRNILASALQKPDLAPKVINLCTELEPLVKSS